MTVKETIVAIETCLAELAGTAGRTNIGDDDRRQLLSACSRLKAAMESPIDVLTRIMFAPIHATTLRVCRDMGVFNTLVAADGKPCSAAELASAHQVDAVLIVRFMRVITALDLAKEVDEQTYASLPITALLADTSPMVEGIQHIGPTNEALMKLPGYFEANGFRNPSDAYNGPFQYAMDTKEHFFEWTSNHPKQQSALNAVMRMSARNKGQDWFEYYPTEQLLKGIGPDRTAIVDIGGGTGQNLAALINKNQDFSDKVVLEDLPGVIDTIKEPISGVKAMGYDFFTAQPVKDARAYFMRTVLHDWPDAQASQILKRIHAAMAEDSVLLVNEQILPAMGVSLSAAQGDIAMMTQFAALERTHRQWLALLETSGFEVVKTWHPKSSEAGERALLEARLRKD